MFLEWNITAGNYSRLRLISSSETWDIPSLTVDHTMFRFVRESREPLNITLVVINATADWQISCIEYLSLNFTQNTLETTVRVITMTHINSKFLLLTAYQLANYNIIIVAHSISIHTGYLNTSLDTIAVEPSFREENITLRLSLETEGMPSMMDGLTYSAIFTSSFAEIIRVFSGSNDSASVELTMLYNVQYNVTTSIALCGYENRSDALSLFYSELI